MLSPVMIRNVAGALVLLLLATAGLAGCTATGKAAPVPPAKPNVVVIMTDDQWYESLAYLPHTRELIGDAGVSFDRAYASTPLCCPSRSTFLSGQYAHNHGVRHNVLPQGGYARLDEANTLPMWLQRAGYVTSHIGKYPNGYGQPDETHVPPGWDEWRGSVDPATYRMWGYRLNENGVLRTYGDPEVEDPKLYQSDVYRDKGADFITRQARAGKPFFLSLSFLAPHQEAPSVRATRQHTLEPEIGPGPRPAPRHAGAFAQAPFPRDPSIGETDLTDKPAFLQAYPKLDKSTSKAIEASYRGRLESLLAVDEAVRTLVDTLKAARQLDNTYLIFTSDNGFFFGEHGIPTGKFLPHEASAHVPLLMRGPGIPAGGHSDELTTIADVTATITGLTRARPTLPLDGRSLLPFAADPRLRTSRPLLHEAAAGALPSVLPPVGDSWSRQPRVSEGDRRSGKAAARGDLDQERAAPTPARKNWFGEVTSAAYESIRTDRYLYTRYGTGERELYDLRNDPHELTSRHNDPRYARVLSYLDDELNGLQSCVGRTCLRPLPAPPRPAGTA